MNAGNRQCIFCDHKADSQEHIWSNWILKILPAVKDGKFTRRFADGSMKTWPVAKPVLTLGKVCKKQCNNGWMSTRLEDPMKAATESIILRNTSKVFTNAELAVVAAWAFKTTILANHMDESEEPFFSKEQRRAFARNLTIPKGVHVWLSQRNAGHLTARHLSFKRVQQPEMPIAPHLKQVPISPYRFEIYDCIFSVGYLLLQVVAARWTEKRIARPLDFPTITQAEFFDLYAIPIWPNNGLLTVQWPPPRPIGNALFEKFCNRFEKFTVPDWMS